MKRTLAKLANHGVAAPMLIGSRLLERLLKLRHRAHAALGRNVRIPLGGWVESGGSPQRITIGKRTTIRGQLFVFPHGGSITVGEWCFVGEGAKVWSSKGITIGDRVLISHNVNIHDTNSHSIDHRLRHQQYQEIVLSGHPSNAPGILDGPVSIGDDAWIGFDATILKGVSVGQGAIVGARSVVTEDVPPWTIVAGNPARTVRVLDASER